MASAGVRFNKWRPFSTYGVRRINFCARRDHNEMCGRRPAPATARGKRGPQAIHWNPFDNGQSIWTQFWSNNNDSGTVTWLKRHDPQKYNPIVMKPGWQIFRCTHESWTDQWLQLYKWDKSFDLLVAKTFKDDAVHFLSQMRQTIKLEFCFVFLTSFPFYICCLFA